MYISITLLIIFIAEKQYAYSRRISLRGTGGFTSFPEFAHIEIAVKLLVIVAEKAGEG